MQKLNFEIGDTVDTEVYGELTINEFHQQSTENGVTVKANVDEDAGKVMELQIDPVPEYVVIVTDEDDVTHSLSLLGLATFIKS